jgi:hypothetical protein
MLSRCRLPPASAAAAAAAAAAPVVAAAAVNRRLPPKPLKIFSRINQTHSATKCRSADRVGISPQHWKSQHMKN